MSRIEIETPVAGDVIEGTAIAGHEAELVVMGRAAPSRGRKIQSVQVRIDDGPFEDAEPSARDGSWSRWSFRRPLTETGYHVVTARSVETTGLSAPSILEAEERPHVWALVDEGTARGRVEVGGALAGVLVSFTVFEDFFRELFRQEVAPTSSGSLDAAFEQGRAALTIRIDGDDDAFSFTHDQHANLLTLPIELEWRPTEVEGDEGEPLARMAERVRVAFVFRAVARARRAPEVEVEYQGLLGETRRRWVREHGGEVVELLEQFLADQVFPPVLEDVSLPLPELLIDGLGEFHPYGEEQEALEDDVSYNSPGRPLSEKITLRTRASRIPAGGATATTIVAVLRDADGRRVVSPGYMHVTFSADAGELSEVTDHGDGSFSVRLTSAPEAGTATVTGTLHFDRRFPAGGRTERIHESAQVEFMAEATPPCPRATRITAVPSFLRAEDGGWAVVVVRLRDARGQPIEIGGWDVRLQTNAGELPAEEVVDGGDGTFTALLLASGDIETVRLTGTIAGERIEDEATVHFVGPRARLPDPEPDAREIAILADPGDVEANGEAEAILSIQLYDDSGRPVMENASRHFEDLNLTTSLGSLGEVRPVGGGAALVGLVSTDPGIAVVSGTFRGETLGASAKVEFVSSESPPGPPSADQSRIEVHPTAIAADGRSTAEVTVRLRDEDGRRVRSGGHRVDIRASAGRALPLADNGDGTYSFTLRSSRTDETARITARLAGQPLATEGSIEFAPRNAPPPNRGRTTSRRSSRSAWCTAGGS